MGGAMAKKVEKVVRMNIPFTPDAYRMLRAAKARAVGETMIRLVNEAVIAKYGNPAEK
jgi:hypothetical protein